MKTFLPIALATSALFLSAAPARAGDPVPPTPRPAPVVTVPVVTIPTYVNATCPIMGKPSSKALFVDTDYGRIYICCPPCVKKIKQDPAKAYEAAYPVPKKAGNTVDPVTGAAIGASTTTVLLQGYEIALASEASVKPARANSQIVLVKALNPDVTDVGNGTDPITGLAVVDNAFVLIDRDLVHLSSPDVVAQVRLSPEAARAAAKAIAAKEAAAREKAKAATPPK